MEKKAEFKKIMMNETYKAEKSYKRKLVSWYSLPTERIDDIFGLQVSKKVLK
jgi:hypothetical protein